jgi:hypothetical protein
MISIPDLWMPIVVSAVFIFILSAILHMVFKYHHADFRPLPDEASVLDKLRSAGVTPGLYHFPYCANHKDMGTEEMKAKMEKGPVGLMTVFPSGPPAMGKYLGLWFAYTVLVGVFVAYIAGRTLERGEDYLAVFRFAGTVAFMSYGVASVVNSIWKGQPWSATLKEVFDGLLYSLVTGGTFGWLWPR